MAPRRAFKYAAKEPDDQNDIKASTSFITQHSDSPRSGSNPSVLPLPPPVLKGGVSSKAGQSQPRRRGAEKKSVKINKVVKQIQTEANDSGDDTPAFVMVNGIRLFLPNPDEWKAAEEAHERSLGPVPKPLASTDSTGKDEATEGTVSNGCSDILKDEAKEGSVSNGCSDILINKTSNDIPPKPEVTKLRSRIDFSDCVRPGDYLVYRKIREKERRKLHQSMRKAGFKIPFARFEPEYVPLKPHNPYEQEYKPQLIMLAGFTSWWALCGGVLAYRIWALHVGYSPQWHWTSIHADLRFDDSMWTMYVISSGSLVLAYGAAIVGSLWFGDDWWRDLIAFGIIKAWKTPWRSKAYRVLQQWKKKMRLGGQKKSKEMSVEGTEHGGNLPGEKQEGEEGAVGSTENGGNSSSEEQEGEEGGVEGTESGGNSPSEEQQEAEGAGGNEGEERKEVKVERKWNMGFDDNMVFKSRTWIYLFVGMAFMLFPIALGVAWVVVIASKEKCPLHDDHGARFGGW